MYHGERFNAYSHLIGALLAILATVLLVIKAVGQGELAVAAASVYGGALIFLYGVHSIPQRETQIGESGVAKI